VNRCTVILPAAGRGTRFGSDLPKQYLLLRQRPLIAHTVERFLAEEQVERIIVCAAEDRIETVLDIAAGSGWSKVAVISGGLTRRDSVIRGVEEAERHGAALVAVHDSVRPFFRSGTFRALLEAAAHTGAALPAIPVSDTIHRVQDEFIVETPERASLYRAQTPQCFRLPILKAALQQAVRDGFAATDEAGAVARTGHQVRVVLGDLENIKITHPEELAAAEANFDLWSSR
jgi:2-C-methyl-D-erythritol 4-phosphate cytidylyltransferase